MSVKVRLARWGAKKNPYYHIVVSDSRSPRDGKFIQVIGKYDPLQDTMDKRLVSLDLDRTKYWLGVGAQPTDKIRQILAFVNLMEAKPNSQKTKKHLPKSKAQERIKEKQERLAAQAKPSDDTPTEPDVGAESKQDESAT